MPVNPKAKYIITAENQDQRAWLASESMAKKASQKISGYLKAAFAAFSVGAIVRATMGAEQAFAQLESAVKSTGGVAGFAAKDLAAMSSELQNLTTYADDSIQSMQSVLLTFTKIRGSEFKDAQLAILNMATRLGVDLKSAAIQVGKALNDPLQGVTALSRAGVQLSKEQKQLIKSFQDAGNFAAAQRAILAELETQFGGAARAARDNFGGALQGLTNAFGDLLEAKGGLPEATAKINELSELLSKPETKEAADTLLTGLISAGVQLVPILEDVVTGIRKLLGGATEIEILENQLRILKETGESIPIFFNFGFLSEGGIVLGPKAIEEQINRIKQEIFDLQNGPLTKGHGPIGKRSTGPAQTGLTRPARSDLTVEEVTPTDDRFRPFGEVLRYEGYQYMLQAEKDLAAWKESLVEAHEYSKSVAEQANEAIADAFKDNEDNLAETMEGIQYQFEEAMAKQEEMSVFAEQAARNMQSHFADFLFDPFDKGVKGMLTGFVDTIRRMLAEAAAAKVFEKLFGGTSSGAGGIVGFLGSLFGGFKAEGGPLERNKWYVAGEHGPEPIWGGGPGAFAAGYGGMGGAMTINAPLSIDARGATQDAVKELVRSMPEIQRRWADQVESRIVTRIKRRQYNLG